MCKAGTKMHIIRNIIMEEETMTMTMTITITDEEREDFLVICLTSIKKPVAYTYEAFKKNVGIKREFMPNNNCNSICNSKR